MAGKRLADQSLYHLTPRGFWKKFRDVTVVNPEISTGLPLPDKNRYPQPGSRPERYSTPATMASDVAQNPYWKRDVRRAYPQLSVITQAEYSKVLLASPQGQSIAPPKESSEENEKSSVPVIEANKSLSEVLEAINKLQPSFSESNLPPVPGVAKNWTPIQEEDAPHDPNAYWPMKMYK